MWMFSVLATQNSDHCPLLLSYGTHGAEDMGEVTISNLRLAGWSMRHARRSLKILGKAVMGIGDPLEVLIGKLEHCKRALLKWSKSRGRKKRLVMAKEANGEN
jgi:hypothetical protein